MCLIEPLIPVLSTIHMHFIVSYFPFSTFTTENKNQLHLRIVLLVVFSRPFTELVFVQWNELICKSFEIMLIILN